MKNPARYFTANPVVRPHAFNSLSSKASLLFFKIIIILASFFIIQPSFSQNITNYNSNLSPKQLNANEIAFNNISLKESGGAGSARLDLTSAKSWNPAVISEDESGVENKMSDCVPPNISQLPVSNLIAYYKMEGDASDELGNNPGTLQGSPSPVLDRFGIANRAYSFNGTSQYISTTNSYINPSSISFSIWFKTTSTVGGALIGFSSNKTGTGGLRDRFIYMTGSGTLYLGVAPNATKKYVKTTAAYNDGKWHMATGTVGAGGLKLYVDAVLIASDATVTSGETTTGFWRIGHDDLDTWPGVPTRYFFEGALDDAIIYHRELTAVEVKTLYSSPDGAGSNSPVCWGSSLNLTATLVAGATYSWTGPNGFTSTLRTPSISFSAAYAGIYTLKATLNGCTSTAYVEVVSTSGSASISYSGSPFCKNSGTGTVTLAGATGGTYTSTTGLSINSTTGAITTSTSTPGNYIVTYTSVGGCSSTAAIVISALPAATISYSESSVCKSSGAKTVTRTGMSKH